MAEGDLEGRADREGEGSGGDQTEGVSLAAAVGWLLGDGDRLVPVPTEAPPPAGTGALAPLNAPALAWGTSGRMPCTLPAAITGTPTATATATTATARCHPGMAPGLAPPCPRQPPGSLPHLLAVRDRLRGGAGAQLEHLLPQPGGERGQRQQPGQGLRAQLAPLGRRAGLALLDVPAGPVQRVHGQPAVPVRQHRGQFRARRPPGAREAQRAEGLFQLAAAARRHGVRLRPGHAEHGGEIGVVQVVPQAQHDGLALFRPEPGEGSRDQGAQLGPFGLPFVRTGPGGPACTFQHGRLNRFASYQRRPAQALAARGREEPGAQEARIRRDAAGGDDERVPGGFRGLGRLAQHPPAVTVNRAGVRVIGSSDPGRVACREGRDDLAVFHEPHGS